ncbi:MAG: DUF2490 domain-containing protein [Cytophagales bacterium]|nr:DUF2490 domain-containing protein [Cytophagales bacterium]
MKKASFNLNILDVYIFIFSISIILFCSVNNAIAQKNVTNRTQSWVGYFNQTRISNKFGFWLDVHFRNLDIAHPHQTLVRPAFIFYINDNFRLNAGYAYVYNFAPEGRNSSFQEHRPWQQLWWRTKYPGFVTTQWLRAEQRFVENVVNDQLTGDFTFNHRFRYNLFLQVPLIGKDMKAKTPYFALQNEIFINAGKNIVYNVFDQNRFFVGFGYYFTDHLHIQLGYMNIFQQRPSGNEFYNNDCIRLFAFHTLDFRKKEETH